MNTICLSPEGRYLRREGLANAAGILPGHVLSRLATEKVEVHGTAEAKPPVIRIADLSVGDAGDITRAYTLGETVHYVTPSAGDSVLLRLGQNQVIAIEDELASAGDGTVKAPAVAGAGVVFIADEAVTTGAAEEKFIRAIVANS